MCPPRIKNSDVINFEHAEIQNLQDLLRDRGSIVQREDEDYRAPYLFGFRLGK